MTKRKKAVVSVAALVLALALLVTAGALWLLVRDKTEVYRDNEPYRYAFGLSYETLNHTADDADRETAQPVLEAVEKAVAYDGYRADFPYDEALLKLCRTRDDNAFDHVQSDVRFVTFQKILNKGYLWLSYDQLYCSANGAALSGSQDILALVEMRFDTDGSWQVTDVTEPA